MSKKLIENAVKKIFFISMFIAASCTCSLSFASQPAGSQEDAGWGRVTLNGNAKNGNANHTIKCANQTAIDAYVQLTLNKKFWPEKIRSWSPKHMWVKLYGYLTPGEEKALDKVGGQVSLGAEFDETIYPIKLGNLRPIKSVVKLASSRQSLGYLFYDNKQAITYASAQLTFGERTLSALLGRFRPSSTEVTCTASIRDYSDPKRPVSQLPSPSGVCLTHFSWVTLKSFFTQKLWPTWMGKMRPAETMLHGTTKREFFPWYSSRSWTQNLGASISYTQDAWPACLTWLRPSKTTLELEANKKLTDVGDVFYRLETTATINYDKKQLPECLGKARPDVQLKVKAQGTSFSSLCAQCKFSLAKGLATLKMTLIKNAYTNSKEFSFGLSFSNETELGK